VRTSDVTRFTISPRPGFFHASYFLLVGPYKCGVRTSDLIRLALNPLPGRLVVRFFFNVVISFDIRGMRTSDLLRFTFFPLPEGMHPEELGTYVLFEINVILRSLPWASYTATHCNTLQHTATHCNTECYYHMFCPRSTSFSSLFHWFLFMYVFHSYMCLW